MYRSKTSNVFPLPAVRFVIADTQLNTPTDEWSRPKKKELVIALRPLLSTVFSSPFWNNTTNRAPIWNMLKTVIQIRSSSIPTMSTLMSSVSENNWWKTKTLTENRRMLSRHYLACNLTTSTFCNSKMGTREEGTVILCSARVKFTIDVCTCSL